MGNDSVEQQVGTYFDRAAVTFDSFYDGKRSPAMQWVDRRFRSDMFERFQRTFQALEPIAGKRVLDVGCGSGLYATEAAARGAAEVLGIDVAPAMLDLARQRAVDNGVVDRCSFVTGAFPDTRPDTAYDASIVMGVMDYIADPPEFLRALRECTTGTAVLSFPSRHWLRTPLRKVRYRIKRCPLWFYDVNEVDRLLRDSGFTSVAVDKIPGAGMDIVVRAS
ncbi:class I SAM-dependent methyltransferase [soil metagenome]